MWAEHSFSFTSLSSSFYHTLSLSFSLASFNCHMSVFHSALRFICMYVFMSFSVWVCTDIYSNIYQLSLFLFPLIHSVSFPLHHSKPSNLSLCQNSEGCNGRWNEQSEGTYICTHVCMCLTLRVKQVKILDICTESITGWPNALNMTLLWQICKLCLFQRS